MPPAAAAPEASTMPSAVHGRNCTTLATRHPIPSVDDRISFAEVGHRYSIDGVEFSGPSVTTLGGMQFKGEKFDADDVCKKNISMWRHNASSKYYDLIQGYSNAEATEKIKELWNDANRLGTTVHYVAECLLNDEAPPASDLAQVEKEFDQLEHFLADYPTLKPWRTELSLFWQRPDGTIAAVGQLDALFQCRKTGKMVLIDFKRVNKTLDPEESDWGRSGKGVLEGYSGNDFNKYSLQLNLYAAMCAQHGIKVDACYLLKLHPDIPEYRLVQAADLVDEAHTILSSL